MGMEDDIDIVNLGRGVGSSGGRYQPVFVVCSCDSPGLHEWRVDRARRTTVMFCRRCGAEWDKVDGPREFAVWAIGFTAGKRATILRASETVEPDIDGAWEEEYSTIVEAGAMPMKGEMGLEFTTQPTTEPAEPDSGGITVEGEITDEAKKRLKESWAQAHTGFSQGDTAPTPLAMEPILGWPGWFLPLMKLRGFTFGEHRRAIEHIASACNASGITPELVVANFVAWWMPRRDQARWGCPVVGLWDELGHHINEVVKAPPHRRAAVLELASASVGLEYGCRYCGEGGVVYKVGGDQKARWPVICTHRSVDPSESPDGWQPRGWGSVVELLRYRLPGSVYTSWVKDLVLLGFDGQVALVECHNRTHATWVYRQIIETLRSTLEAELGRGANPGDVGLEMMMVWEGSNANQS